MAEHSQLNRIEQRRLEFRNRIVAAALKLFERQGVAETSVASIIREADIAHKTFFNHFPSKDHLLKHIACTFSDEAYQGFLQVFDKEPDPRKRIHYCFDRIGSVLETVSGHYKELFNHYLIGGGAPSDLRRRQKEQFSRLIDRVIADARAQNLLRPDLDADLAGEVIIGLCVATLLNWSLEQDYPIRRRLDAMAQFINTTLFVND